MSLIYFDPVGGASGDMILASLIDLGCPVDYLNSTLALLDLNEVRDGNIISVKKAQCNGIAALNLTFAIDDAATERDFASIKNIIEASTVPAPVQERALDIFRVLAEAEAAVHQCEPERVHFHEIGAADSILDITGIAAAIEWFGPEACFCGPLPLGRGTVTSRHGLIPVPAPATVKIIEGMAVRFTGIECELTTPTGAAVLKHLCSGPAPSDLIMGKSGCAAGSRIIPSWPNMFRALLCENPPSAGGTIYIAEADIDDMNPEDWERAIEEIFDAGALDVNLTQRIMKRGRPGAGLRAAVPAEHLDRVLQAVLRHTSSIGARYYPVWRSVLARRDFTVEIDAGPVSVKESVLPDGTRRIKPEFRDLYSLSRRTGLSMENLRRQVLKKTGG